MKRDIVRIKHNILSREDIAYLASRHEDSLFTCEPKDIPRIRGELARLKNSEFHADKLPSNKQRKKSVKTVKTVFDNHINVGEEWIVKFPDGSFTVKVVNKILIPSNGKRSSTFRYSVRTQTRTFPFETGELRLVKLHQFLVKVTEAR